MAFLNITAPHPPVSNVSHSGHHGRWRRHWPHGHPLQPKQLASQPHRRQSSTPTRPCRQLKLSHFIQQAAVNEHKACSNRPGLFMLFVKMYYPCLRDEWRAWNRGRRGPGRRAPARCRASIWCQRVVGLVRAGLAHGLERQLERVHLAVRVPAQASDHAQIGDAASGRQRQRSDHAG